MSEHREHGLDVRLMRILLLLLTECSVSRTAVILGQSQPAVSLALKRLRDILGDPLLVRSGARLVPTDRGLEVAERVRKVLAEIDGLVEPEAAFVPAEAHQRVNIFAVNCLAGFFLPRIAEILRTEAPGMSVDLCNVFEEAAVCGQLEDGSLDLVICNWPVPRDNLRFAPLLNTDMVLVMRKTHPMAGRTRLNMDEYLALDHLSPSPRFTAAISPVDGRLSQLERTRRIAMTVPEFSLVPHVLARTDLVFTSSRPFAEQMAGLMPFAIIDAPAELGAMKFCMLWHERSHRSGRNRWLRDVVRRIASEVNEMSTGVARPNAPYAIFAT
jgi:DNA-binding transcriptional LysR family regulator